MDKLEPKSEEKDTRHSGSWYALEAILIILVAKLVSPLVYFFADQARQGIGIDLVALTLQCALFLLLPLRAITVLRPLSPSVLGIYPPRWRHCFLTGLLYGLVFYLLNALIGLLVGMLFPHNIQSTLLLLQDAANGVEKGILLVLIIVIAPFAEEVLFRGFLLPPLLSEYGRKTGILISAAVFAAVHLDLWLFPQLFVGGLCFNWLYDRYHNIFYNALAHSIWNLTAVGLFLSTA